MPEVMQKSKLSLAQENLSAYFQTHDVKYIAEDAVFKNISTGETHKGRAEVGAMLHFMYHVAFDARLEIINQYVTEDMAVVEGFFKGRHIGEIGGMPASNKEVDVPICLVYDLKEGLIQKARIYFQTDILMKQVGVTAAVPKTTYLVRDIFKLKFGHFKDAKQLLNQALESELLPDREHARVLSDFTGDSYRLIFEEGFASLDAFEQSLSSSMKADEWQQWYEKFKPHVESSHREILKQVL